MSSKTVWWVWAGLAYLSACSDSTPVVIEPGAFTEKWPTALRGELVKNSRCVIDQINGKTSLRDTLTFRSGEPLTLSGWAFSKTDGARPNVYVQLVGPALTYTALAQKRTSRPDVNRHFNLDPAWITGFELQAVQNVEAGEYRVEILQPGNQNIAQCHTKIDLRIDPASNRR